MILRMMPVPTGHDCQLPEPIWPEGSEGGIYARCTVVDCGVEHILVDKITGLVWVQRAVWENNTGDPPEDRLTYRNA